VPPAFVLCVAGECFALGEGLSEAASARADHAFSLLQELCRSSAAWEAHLTAARDECDGR